MTQRNVAVLIFDDVEVLDFCGPFEVFSVTGKRDGSDPFNVYTVAEKTPISGQERAERQPRTTPFDNVPTARHLSRAGRGR